VWGFWRAPKSTLAAHVEPHLDLSTPVPAALAVPPRPRLSDWQRHSRRFIKIVAIVSLLLHVVLLLVIEHYAGRGGYGGYGGQPIPVQLVMQPPQKQPDPPKPPEEQKKQEQQQKKQEQQKPPPPGRLASDEFGDPDATGKVPTATHAPEAGEIMPKEGEAPPPPAAGKTTPKPSDVARPTDEPAEDQSASPKSAEIPPTPEQMAAAGKIAPPVPSHKPETQQEAAAETRKPATVHMVPARPGGAHKPNERPDDPSHGEGHKAKYPGPDATRDEYLAYLAQLTHDRIRTLPPDLFVGRHGMAVFSVRIRPNGKIVWFALKQSSGYRDADQALLQSLNSMADFPPLPSELQQQDGATVLSYSVPLDAVDRND
jgi:TonB family protein